MLTISADSAKIANRKPAFDHPVNAPDATILTAFPAVTRGDATTLILGSMPGIASLDAHRYYAHPRNAFWFIMATIYGNGTAPEHYEDKIAMIQTAGVALWDVLKHCKRPGSLDSKIDPQSVVCNDFKVFIKKHTQLKLIAFNGKTAEQLFKKHVLPDLNLTVPTVSLPSSSPAMAMLTRQQKTTTWQQQLTLS